MVDTLWGRDGRYKLVVTAPEDALLPDGQAVSYSTDGSMSIDTPNKYVKKDLPEDAELGPNQAQYIFVIDPGDPGDNDWYMNSGGFDQATMAWDWTDPNYVPVAWDWSFNFVGDTTLVPDECGMASDLYIYGWAYDPAGDPDSDPDYGDSKKDGVAGIEVKVQKRYGVADPVAGLDWGAAIDVDVKNTDGLGYFFFSVRPETWSIKGVQYRVCVDGTASDWFNANVCPPADSVRKGFRYNVPAAAYTGTQAD